MNVSFLFFPFLFILFSNRKFADGDGGMHAGNCPNRTESSPLDDRTKSLVLVNYFPTIPFKQIACEHNSANLINMLHTCFGAAGNRWANFVAVNFYKVCQFSSLVSLSFVNFVLPTNWSFICIGGKRKGIKLLKQK